MARVEIETFSVRSGGVAFFTPVDRRVTSCKQTRRAFFGRAYAHVRLPSDKGMTMTDLISILVLFYSVQGIEMESEMPLASAQCEAAQQKPG